MCVVWRRAAATPACLHWLLRTRPGHHTHGHFTRARHAHVPAQHLLPHPGRRHCQVPVLRACPSSSLHGVSDSSHTAPCPSPPPQFANTSGTPGIDAGQLSLSTKGSDYALEATATRGDRMGGDAFKVTYFQSVARALALGGTLNMQVAKGSWAAPEAVSWGLNGAWQSADMSHAVLGEYDSAQNEVMAA